MTDEIIKLIKDHENEVVAKIISEEDALLQKVIDEATNLFLHMRGADEFRLALLTFVLAERKKGADR